MRICAIEHGKTSAVRNVLVVLIIICTTWFYYWLQAKKVEVAREQRLAQVEQGKVPTIKLNIYKGQWSEVRKDQFQPYRTVRVTPPVRRHIMINNDPGRMFVTGREIDPNLDFGPNIYSIRFMVDGTEENNNAVLEYTLK